MEEHAVYRVLMVEDDRGIAQAVQTQGELWNLQVRQVRDLRHVMEEFAAFDPHLVLLDIGLCPASTATIGARRSAGYPGCR